MSVKNSVFVFGANYTPSNVIVKDFLTNLTSTIENIPEGSFESLIVLSTCNRFEVIGFGDIENLITIFQKEISSFETVRSCFHQKKNDQAIEYLFRLACGLESKILGDIEILGQFRKATLAAKSNNNICSLMERLTNTVIHAAKDVRLNTQITSGTTSLSYAVIQILKQYNLSCNQNILMIGMGTFGKSLVRNLSHYYPENKLTLTNRSYDKCMAIAKEIECSIFPFEEIADRINNYNIIIAAISEFDNQFSIKLDNESIKMTIDLSVPSFFNDEMFESDLIQRIDIDMASEIINTTLVQRKSSIENAEIILKKYIQEFKQWDYINENYVKQWKNNFSDITNDCNILINMDNQELDLIRKRSTGDLVKYVKANSFSKNLQPLDFLKSQVQNSCLVKHYTNESDHLNCNLCLGS